MSMIQADQTRESSKPFWPQAQSKTNLCCLDSHKSARLAQLCKSVRQESCRLGLTIVVDLWIPCQLQGYEDNDITLSSSKQQLESSYMAFTTLRFIE